MQNNILWSWAKCAINYQSLLIIQQQEFKPQALFLSLAPLFLVSLLSYIIWYMPNLKSELMKEHYVLSLFIKFVGMWCFPISVWSPFVNNSPIAPSPNEEHWILGMEARAVTQEGWPLCHNPGLFKRQRPLCSVMSSWDN